MGAELTSGEDDRVALDVLDCLFRRRPDLGDGALDVEARRGATESTSRRRRECELCPIPESVSERRVRVPRWGPRAGQAGRVQGREDRRTRVTRRREEDSMTARENIYAHASNQGNTPKQERESDEKSRQGKS